MNATAVGRAISAIRLVSSRNCRSGRRGFMPWLAAACLMAATASAAPVESWLFGLDASNDIVAIDPLSQTTAMLVSTGLVEPSNSLAYNRDRDQLLFISNGDLYYWNVGQSFSAVDNLVQAGFVSTDPANAAFYGNSYWYLERMSNVLVERELSYGPGNTPSIAATNSYTISQITSGGVTLRQNRPADIAVDATTGKLYASTSLGRFYTIDLDDPLNTFEEVKAGDGSGGYQLAFDRGYELLYGHRFSDGTWYTINRTTGEATPLTGFVTTSSVTGFRDLDGAAVAPVPEPSTLVLAATGCIGLCAWGLRRRRVDAFTAVCPTSVAA